MTAEHEGQYRALNDLLEFLNSIESGGSFGKDEFLERYWAFIEWSQGVRGAVPWEPERTWRDVFDHVAKRVETTLGWDPVVWDDGFAALAERSG